MHRTREQFHSNSNENYKMKERRRRSYKRKSLMSQLVVTLHATNPFKCIVQRTITKHNRQQKTRHTDENTNKTNQTERNEFERSERKIM